MSLPALVTAGVDFVINALLETSVFGSGVGCANSEPAANRPRAIIGFIGLMQSQGAAVYKPPFSVAAALWAACVCREPILRFAQRSGYRLDHDAAKRRLHLSIAPDR